ncbi:MAG: hypothetical protein KBS81_05040, partial [Spirochaetales bacterium]|nr:hypothetical protein [Candidatus Physcosoma equi]
DEQDTCPYCSRMIYVQELPANEEKNYIFDDFEANKSNFKAVDAPSVEDGDEDDDILETDDSDGFEDL